MEPHVLERASMQSLEESMELDMERSGGGGGGGGGTERSSVRSSVRSAPLTRIESLSQMVLTVQDFVTALDGYVPVSLRGLPLHSAGAVNFSHVGGLERAKQILTETLLWPSKVSCM